MRILWVLLWPVVGRDGIFVMMPFGANSNLLPVQVLVVVLVLVVCFAP